jgi:3,4-dihydroxy-2-butanone 4-phosphate synthase
MLDSIESAIEEIKAGRIVIVVDDEDRENEGDCCPPRQPGSNKFYE